MHVPPKSQPHHTLPLVVPPPNCFSILVIDDGPPNRLLLRKVLSGAGYAVTEACDGAEALVALISGAACPNLIVTDIEMPGMGGIQFLEELRKLESPVSQLPVIAASGNADQMMQHEALAAGADLFLTKPFDFPLLRREIADLIKTRRIAADVKTTRIFDRMAANRVSMNLRRVG